MLAEPPLESPGLDSVSFGQLRRVLAACTRISREVLHRNRKGVLQAIADSLQDLLDVESVSVFLVEPDDPGYLVLSAERSEKFGDAFRPVRIEIHHRLEGGLTGYLAYAGKPYRGSGEQLKKHKYATGMKPAHLREDCDSLLSLPINDRKGRRLGLIKIDNKRSAREFDSEDEALATILRDNSLVLALEVLRFEDALQTLMNALGSANRLESLLATVLKKSLPLVDAGRGTIGWWHAEKSSLLIEATWGGTPFQKGTIVPEESSMNRVFGLARTAWRRSGGVAGAESMEDVDSFPDDSGETRSEIVLPLIGVRGRPLGVLAAEAGLGEAGLAKEFDAQDRDLLKSIARYTAAAAEEVQNRVAIASLTSEKGELKEILAALQTAFHYDAALIWAIDLPNKRLVLRETVGCPEPNRAGLFFPHGETSLAWKVQHERQWYFSQDPSSDCNVSKRMWDILDIQGPLLGVPLDWGGRTIGVLVVWGRKDRPMEEEHAEQLVAEILPYARRAAGALSALELEQRKQDVLEQIRLILLDLQNRANRAEVLDRICRSVIADGFDRVRVFEYRDNPPRFVGAWAAGMKKKFAGVTLLVSANPYSQHTYDDAMRGNWSARSYFREFGPDPDLEKLEKDGESPWAVVPLATKDRIYGQIAADRAVARVKISEEQLEFLTILGALGTQALANDEIVNLRTRQEQGRAVDYVLSHAFHDIKTPTSFIAASVQMLADKRLPPGRKDELIVDLLQEVQVLDKLVKQSSDYTLNAIAPPIMSTVDLQKLVESSVRRLSPAARQRGVVLTTSIPTSACEVTADPNRIYVALDNLLDNAIRFSPIGSTVEINLKAEIATYVVEVVDHGPGVPPNLRAKIFEPFRRIRHPDAEPSTGLGLAIAKAIIEVHQGQIQCEAGAGGTGSRFWFSLPR